MIWLGALIALMFVVPIISELRRLLMARLLAFVGLWFLIAPFVGIGVGAFIHWGDS